MSRKNKIICLVSVVLAVALIIGAGTAAAADFGSQSDPLVTLSYIDDIFTPEILSAFQEKLDSTNSNDPNNYELVQTTVFSGNINETMSYDVNPNQFTGFTYRFSTVTTYKKDGDTYIVDDTKKDGDTQLSGKLTAGGLEFKVYYSRNSVGYTIKLMEWGTHKPLGKGELGQTEYKVGSTHDFTAPGTLTVAGGVEYNFYPTAEKPQTQTLTIQQNEELNVLIFYYQMKQVTIYYHAVCLTPGAKDKEFGFVSNNMQDLTTDQVDGSTAMASTGFEFLGWYNNADCTGDPVSAEAYLKPAVPNEDVHYYALFAPITTSLTLANQVRSNTPVMPQDAFLFRVQGVGKTDYIDLTVAIQGTGSVILEGLPVGEYIITELTGWSWKHDNLGWQFDQDGDGVNGAAETAEITLSTDAATITYSNMPEPTDWLSGEDMMDNGKNNP